MESLNLFTKLVSKKRGGEHTKKLKSIKFGQFQLKIKLKVKRFKVVALKQVNSGRR